MLYKLSKSDIELLLLSIKLVQLTSLLDAGAVPVYTKGQPLCEYINELKADISILKVELASIEKHKSDEANDN